MKFTIRNGWEDHNLTRVNARSAKALIKQAKAALESSPRGFVTVYCSKARSPWNSFFVCGKRDESEVFSAIEDFFKIVRLLDGHPALEDWVWTLHRLPVNERLAAVRKYVKGGFMMFDLHLAEYVNQRQIAAARREWCWELHGADEFCNCDAEAREAEELAKLAWNQRRKHD